MKRYYVAPRENKFMMVEVIDNNSASALFAGDLCDGCTTKFVNDYSED